MWTHSMLNFHNTENKKFWLIILTEFCKNKKLNKIHKSIDNFD